MKKLEGKVIRHRNNFDVCFAVMSEAFDTASESRNLRGWWLNISDLSGKEIFPIIDQQIVLTEAKLIDWFVYENERSAHKHSNELRKVKQNVL